VRKGRSRVVVLCNSSGSHFGYAETLNKLGYYSVSLCSRVAEVVCLLELGIRFEYLVYDGFDLRKHADHLKKLVKHNGIGSIIAVSDVNSRECKTIFLWAKDQEIPLGSVLQAPLRSNELYKLIGSNPLSDESFL